ncbi:MAG TPA: helix-turn-helix domain-containing protein [Gemmataceae bacterium]|nr:helix-turn-helix domain-containing protein [Gemmataceae bacterium]
MPEMFTVKETAMYLNVPVATLRWWRAQGTGPPAAKLGKHLRYDKDELDQWIAEQKRKENGS